MPRYNNYRARNYGRGYGRNGYHGHRRSGYNGGRRARGVEVLRFTSTNGEPIIKLYWNGREWKAVVLVDTLYGFGARFRDYVVVSGRLMKVLAERVAPEAPPEPPEPEEPEPEPRDAPNTVDVDPRELGL